MVSRNPIHLFQNIYYARCDWISGQRPMLKDGTVYTIQKATERKQNIKKRWATGPAASKSKKKKKEGQRLASDNIVGSL